jgi:ribonuclease T1
MIARRLAAAALCALGLGLAFAPSAAAQKALPHAVAGEMRASELPSEARATLALIRKGGPFPYARDGALFANREGSLPFQRRGYYHEYTVKTPHVRTRGARRIIAGADGDRWYTDDHYNHYWRILE